MRVFWENHFPEELELAIDFVCRLAGVELDNDVRANGGELVAKSQNVQQQVLEALAVAVDHLSNLLVYFKLET